MSTARRQCRSIAVLVLLSCQLDLTPGFANLFDLLENTRAFISFSTSERKHHGF
jgi:hypothetical protein